MNMLSNPRRALLRCLQYVQRDLREIVIPSSIPDISTADDPQAARVRARDILKVIPHPLLLTLLSSCQNSQVISSSQAFVDGTREYGDSWRRRVEAPEVPGVASGGDRTEDISKQEHPSQSNE